MGSSDKFCLRWNDFETNISAAFQELRNDEDFFDVTLCCGPDGTDRLRAHKVILSACSPFFRGILKNNPHANPLIYLRGVTMEDLNALLNFMYHGEANVTQEDLNSFLAVAEDLDVKGLTSNDQEKATKRAGVDTAKFKRKSSGGAVSAKKRKVEDETAFDEGSAVVKSETVSDDTFADDFSLEESYADEEGGNGDYDKSAGDDLEDYGEEGDPVAGTSSDGAKEVCTGGVNFEVVQGSRANTYMYVDKTDGYSYGKERESKGSVFLRCRWFNKSKDTGTFESPNYTIIDGEHGGTLYLCDGYKYKLSSGGDSGQTMYLKCLNRGCIGMAKVSNESSAMMLMYPHSCVHTLSEI